MKKAPPQVGLFYFTTNPNNKPINIIDQDGIFEKANRQNVPIVNPKFNKEFSKG